VSTKIIYVAGTSFTGSTILEAVLNSHPDIICGGEIAQFIRDSIERPQIMRCACRNILAGCTFWSAVKHAWSMRTGEKELGRFYELLRRFERFRAVPAMSTMANMGTADFEEYQRYFASLLQVIREVGARPVVADTSKNPARGLALSLLPDVEVYFIHLIRHGLAVVSSTIKHKTSHGRRLPHDKLALVASASLKWARNNLVDEYAIAISSRPAYRLRYEDFVMKSTLTIRQVGEFLAMDVQPVADRLERRGEFPFDHVLGNPANKQGPAVLNLDYTWPLRLPVYPPFVFNGLQGLVAKRYGYPGLASK
jgi:hypothetical protein